MGYTTDFLLVMTADDGDLIADGSRVDLALVGATLCDLVQLGHLALDKDGKVTVADESPTGSAVLDEAQRRFAERTGKKVAGTLPKVAKDLRDGVYAELQTQGAVQREEFKTLGIFSRHRWPVQDPARSADLHRAVLEAIEQPQHIGAHVAGLVSLVNAIDAVKEVTRDLGSSWSLKDLKKSAKAIAEGELAGAAVGKAIRDAQAAVNAAVIGATTATVITST